MFTITYDYYDFEREEERAISRSFEKKEEAIAYANEMSERGYCVYSRDVKVSEVKCLGE